MRQIHLMDYVWENGLAILLGAFFLGIVVFALFMGGF